MKQSTGNSETSGSAPVDKGQTGSTASNQKQSATFAKTVSTGPGKRRGKGTRSRASSAPDQSKRPAIRSAKPTKKSKLIKLLSRKRGCGMDVMMKELDWQAHTIRAAITRFKQEGYEITRTSSSSGKAVYQLVQPSNGRIQ